MKPIAIFSFIIFVCLIILPGISVAEDLKYFPGTTYDNDPYEFQVNPGDTIYLGRTYDLRNVMGTNHTLALWYDWRYGGSNCNPDAIFPIGYIETNGLINPKAVYLDPAKGWRIGDYYSWDGCYYTYNFKSLEREEKTYSHDYNFMFTVINPPERPVKTASNASQIIVNNTNQIRGDTSPKMPVLSETNSIRGKKDTEQSKIKTITPSPSIRGVSDNADEIVIVITPEEIPNQQQKSTFWESIPWWAYIIVLVIIILIVIFLFG